VRRGGVGLLVQEREVIGEDALHAFELAGDAHEMSRQFLDGGVVLERQRGGDRLLGVHPLDAGTRQRQEKVLKPGAAAELSVGDDLQSDALLQLDDIGNRRVLELFELVEFQWPRDLAILIAFRLRAGLQQVGGAQQASDVLCAKRRCAHDTLPWVAAAAADRITRGDPAYSSSTSAARRVSIAR